jgi:hypothetical protein
MLPQGLARARCLAAASPALARSSEGTAACRARAPAAPLAPADRALT